jgi:hypothetical protein
VKFTNHPCELRNLFRSVNPDLRHSLLSWLSQLRMDENAKVSFSIQPFEKAFAVTPAVNGLPLTEMILTFEREQGSERRHASIRASTTPMSTVGLNHVNI